MAETLATILGRIQVAGNLQVAAAVSMDGFLIDAARAEGVELDPEEFAALATNGVMVVKALGRGINLGDINSAIFEYRDGSVVVSTLDDDFALALLAGKEANLGHLRLLARRYRDDLVNATAAVA